MVFLINLIILLSAIYISNLGVNRMDEYEEGFQEYSTENNLKNAGSWTLTPFVIDDDGGGDYTWLEASSEDWRSGLGTWNNPYIIENITINGQNASTCLEIRDSTTYFVVRNCKAYNSSSPDSGLSLNNVENGIISNNNFSTNYYGISIRNCINVTINNNTLNNNLRYGLYARNSDSNKIFNNTVIGNDIYGMLFSQCEYSLL